MEHLDLELSSSAPKISKDFALYIQQYPTQRAENPVSFHEFPGRYRWKVDDEGKLEWQETRGQQLVPPERNINRMFQSWLFLGLIRAVVYDGDNVEGESLKILDYVDDGKLSTKHLPLTLHKWYQRETHPDRDRSKQIMRMIRAQSALELARKVVRKTCSESNLRGYRPRQTKEQNPDTVQDGLAAIVMVLGETLSNAMSIITRKAGFRAQGWQADEQEGWGTPAYILSRMRKKRDVWCERRIYLLRCQLQQSAIGLVTAFDSSDGPQEADVPATRHEDCTWDTCVIVSQQVQKYRQEHQSTCRHRFDCEATENKCVKDEGNHDQPTCQHPCYERVGVEKNDICTILNKNKIPLLQYRREGDAAHEFSIDIVEYEPGMEYAAVSHVWTDGIGNPEENSMLRCQLEYLRRQFNEAWWRIDVQGGRTRRGDDHSLDLVESRPLTFWIDTLAVPAHPDNAFQRDAHAMAIKKIHETFTNASYTIILDSGIAGMERSRHPEKTAMKILVSGWMKRLWTLQEAFLSGRILFAFSSGLVDLEIIPRAPGGGMSGLLSRTADAARDLHDNLIESSRQARKLGLKGSDSVNLLVGVWRATQYRTTTHLDHETLALATLLNLDSPAHPFKSTDAYKDTASLPQDKAQEHNKELDGLMRDFLKLVDTSAPGAIPPGIIFLPGERVQVPGFGWAPRSWMVVDEDHVAQASRAMTTVFSKSSIAPNGLLVTYPGFLLHTTNRQDCILNPPPAKPYRYFRFPIDNALLDWYQVNLGETISSRAGVERQPEPQLAIIMSHPRAHTVPEIGLLVEVETVITPAPSEAGRQRAFVVKALRRVFVNRVEITTPRHEWIASTQNDDVVIGERLPESQEWHVDSYVDTGGGKDLSGTVEQAAQTPQPVLPEQTGPRTSTIPIASHHPSIGLIPPQRVGASHDALARFKAKAAEPVLHNPRDTTTLIDPLNGGDTNAAVKRFGTFPQQTTKPSSFLGSFGGWKKGG